jgi:transcriptional regulator GlxA family with amidase domain
MQRAAHLLRSTPMSITQIASLVGYENAFAFSTAFKRFFALNPSTFRQKS